MTYLEQRKGQLFCLHFLAIGFAFLVAPVAQEKPWMLLILFGGWELILWATSTHKCWSPDVDLNAQVPLDREGKPLE